MREIERKNDNDNERERERERERGGGGQTGKQHAECSGLVSVIDKERNEKD